MVGSPATSLPVDERSAASDDPTPTSAPALGGRATAASTQAPVADPRVLRVALFNESGLLREGIAAVLGRHPSLRLVDCRRGDQPVDLLLLDPWQARVMTREQVARLRTMLQPRTLVCFSWKRTPEAMLETAGIGFDQYVSKNIAPDQLVEALLGQGAASVTERTVPSDADRSGTVTPLRPDLPAVDDGTGAEDATEDGGLSTLSARELEVLRLVMEGISNDEIGARLFLSKNTVKSYIRNAYRKIGVTRRSQAVRWGFEHLPPLR